MKKFSLHQLSKNELANREMEKLIGGGPGNCRCGCSGPSGIIDNNNANQKYGYTITGSDGDMFCSCVDEYNRWGVFYG